MVVFSLVPALWNRPCLAVHDGKGKGVALEIGYKCYLGDEGQILLQALPAGFDQYIILAPQQNRAMSSR
jgi:hypothetical protein